MAATISNLMYEAENFLANATLEGSDQTNVDVATFNGATAFTSNDAHINLNGIGSDNAFLTGDQDLSVYGNNNQNKIVGNDGDNYISTGASGNDEDCDQVAAGEGNDTIVIDGFGAKLIDGGQGEDHFIIKLPLAEGSDSDFVGLTLGDSLTIENLADSNGNGLLDWGDVDGTSTNENGHLQFDLGNGTHFSLEGITEVQAYNGDIAYEIIANGDGTYDVTLTAA